MASSARRRRLPVVASLALALATPAAALDRSSATIAAARPSAARQQPQAVAAPAQP